jgi:uncharacterized protein YkwD
MPAYTCPQCQKPFRMPEPASAAQVVCPHCRQTVTLPKTSASRWFFARAKKKYGPYTWQQLLTLAQRGELQPTDMLLQEGTQQWMRADAFAVLFAEVATAVTASAPPTKARRSTSEPTTPPSVTKNPARRAFPWLIVGLAGVGACALLAVCLIVGYVFDPRLWSQGQVVENTKKQIDKEPTKKIDPPKKDGKTDDKKKTPEVKKPKTTPAANSAEQFVARLNRHRQSAGLGTVTLDPELSAGCQAHAKYLARNFDPLKDDPSSLADEDPQKPGFSVEGQRAGQIAAVSYGKPLETLERWMGRLVSRVKLLMPEIQSVGIGFEADAKGDWVCVLDAERGRDAPIVVFPAPKQTDVPRSFTSGPEAPEDKTAAGFPISATFPPDKQVTAAKIELRDEKDNLVEGTTWTPEKPLRPGQQRNTIALIPKGLLYSGGRYQVQASAQVNGKPWNLAWSFTTEDDNDSQGTWAKKALAKVNAWRANAGLKPVELDDALSRGCLKHARYLVINEGHPKLQGLSAHDEDLQLPGASEEGQKAGKASDIGIGDYEPIDSVDAWMATLYHRVPILEPNLQRIGFACARGRRQGWAAVMNVLSGQGKPRRPHAVFYPAPDQTGVPLNFPNSGEEPNPIPQDKTGRAGFPITASFPDKEAFKNAIGRLTNDQGIEVPCWLSSPEKLANPQYPNHQSNTTCLIAKEPLTSNRTYHVHLQGQLAGKAWEKKWKFTTGDGGLTAPAATRQVVERLNQYRAQAGLSALTLDEKLSRGCRFHAEYLVKNAETLKKTNAKVNDEDVNLPGFTQEGLRSSQQSLIFTNAPTPVLQIDDLMGSFSSRILLLDPAWQRIGYGCSHDVGRGWRCVLDINGGHGDSRIVVYPAPKQDDVPTVGFDRFDDVKGNPGFPITVSFPRQANLRNVQAVLKDADGKPVDFRLSTPEKPLNAKMPRGTIGVYPHEPLQAGQVYHVIVSVIQDGTEWRESWQFTTR